GSNSAHNLPLPGNPSRDPQVAQLFNEGAARLFVPADELERARALFANHEAQQRPKERDHELASFRVAPPRLPEIPWQSEGGERSPMAGIDQAFAALVQANPSLRVRVGNPDEMRSNRL